MAEYSTFGDGTHDRYPDRPPFFAHRFVRLLTKSCAAQNLGSECCWMLTVIAHQEDAKRYTGAVTFWTEQFLPLVGFGSKGRLIRARNKAIEAGWLHFEAGTRTTPARYWCLIPPSCEPLSDEPIDAGDEALLRAVSRSKTERQMQRKTGRKCDRKRNATETGNGTLSTLILNPDPAPNPKTRAHTIIPADLSHLIDAWNTLPDGIAPRVVKRDSREILRAWRRASKAPEAGPLLREPEAVMAAVRESVYLHGQTWFRFVWLVKQDSQRVTWNVLKLMDGRYRDAATKPERSRRRSIDALRRFANGE